MKGLRMRSFVQERSGWISQKLAEVEEAWLVAHHELEAEEGVC